MKKILIPSIAIIILLFTNASYSDPAATEASPNKEQAEESDENSGFVPIPMIAYTTDTSVMFILSGLYFWEPANQNGDRKSNVISLFAMYTLKNQVTTALVSNIYLLDHSLKNKNVLLFSRSPKKFYGIGPRTSSDDEETFTPMTFKYKGNLLFKIFNNLYVGPSYSFSFHKIEESEITGQLENSTIRGHNGTLNSGFGFEIDCDTRDNTFFPLEGYWIQGKIHGFHRYTGSRDNYYYIDLDFRHFISFFENHVFAYEFRTVFSGGEIPFQEMPLIGGAMLMRGFYRGRYVDKTMVALQGEYRFPLYERLGGVLFFGAAQVASRIDRIEFHSTKLSGGLGLRFALIKSKMINLRLDFAFSEMPPGKDGFGVYFMLREAF